jgi:hypothetical protein
LKERRWIVEGGRERRKEWEGGREGWRKRKIESSYRNFSKK